MDYTMNWEGPDGEKVDVINLSLGSRSLSQSMQKNARGQRKESLVAAAGNNSGYVGDPASWPDTITVSQQINKKVFMVFKLGPEIDLAAPGRHYKHNSRRKIQISIWYINVYSSCICRCCNVRAESDLTADEVRYLMARTAVTLEILERSAL